MSKYPCFTGKQYVPDFPPTTIRDGVGYVVYHFYIPKFLEDALVDT